MAWQPLSVRAGKRQPSGPFDGLPPHLARHVINWITDRLVDSYSGELLDDQALINLAVVTELPLGPGTSVEDIFYKMQEKCAEDADFCLDVLDSMLHLQWFPIDTIEQLSDLLTLGNSVWDIAPDSRSLVWRIDRSAAQQFTLAIAPADVASTELKEAWAKAYSRTPDASDAWDHAIKAVEAILIPIVCPKKDKANLGSVAGELKAQPERWKLLLQSNSPIGSVGTLEAMLRLLWPNPDRHGGAKRRTPELAEAQAAVQLAVTIVQWGRTGVLQRSDG